MDHSHILASPKLPQTDDGGATIDQFYQDHACETLLWVRLGWQWARQGIMNTKRPHSTPIVMRDLRS